VSKPIVLLCFSLTACFALLGLSDLSLGQTELELPAQDIDSDSAEPQIQDVRIGFAGNYKLGCWTALEVDIVGGTTPYTGKITVTVPDTDGVPTSFSTAEDRPVGVQAGQVSTARLFIRVGQDFSSLHVRFSAEDKVRSERTFHAGPELVPGIVTRGMPATNRLVLEFGPSIGLGEVIANNDSENKLLSTRIAHIEDAANLPVNWIGYEAVDTFLITTTKPEIFRPLLQNPARLQALRRWVKLGGRVTIFCGAESEELLKSGGPLAELIPGKFASIDRLRQSHPLETYSEGEQLVAGNRRIDLPIPKLEEIEGQILVHAGSQPTDLPIVVRSRLGLGEVTFVGLDFNRPPLRDWTGRALFLRKTLGWKKVDSDREQLDQGLGTVESLDMIGQLRNTLDSKFTGVEVISFAVVAFLVLGYILLIGPGDYYLVRKVFRRPERTWITFPIFVVGVSAAAYYYAHQSKGDQLRVNQVEVVDIDTTSGLTRGTVWSHYFTPQVDKYDLTILPRVFDDRDLENLDSQVSWLGLPGYALGGMQASGSQTAVFNAGYTFSPERNEMAGLPVQVWSTKTISARWSAQVNTPTITCDLQATIDKLLLGQITNSTGVALKDCLLLYRHWAYHIGPVADGTTVKFDHSKQPRTVKTLLTSAMAGDTTVTDTADDGTVPFQLASSDVTRLLKTMMFFKAINGQRYTGMLNRYQSFVDLSHLLEQDSCAVLVAQPETSGSQWLDDDQPLRSDEDNRWTYYRFVLPVQETTSE